MSKLQRYYAVLSLVAVLSTAILLTGYYRTLAIESITRQVEHSNVVLTRAALSPIKSSLLQYLQAAADRKAGGAAYPPLPAEVLESIKTLMQDRSIVRIKIYDRHGMVAFSSLASQIGSIQHNNPGVVSALNGQVANTLVYRDTFNRFDGENEEENLMQTYIPIRASRAEPALGVFELYSDVKGIVLQIERTEIAIMAGALLIMAALYAVLIIIMRRAGKIIEQQQRTIHEKTEFLQLLSTQMLASEESYKKSIANELHEGLAQTLAAIKLHVEKGRHRKTRDGMADPIIPVLQEAIRKTRTIAKGLRPPDLDDFGLLPTLNNLSSEFEQKHPGIRFDRQFTLEEHEIPASLKIILYRIITSVLDDMTQNVNTKAIHLGIGKKGGSLILLLADTEKDAPGEKADRLANVGHQLQEGFARMKALTTLSGGEFSASQHAAGGIILRAAWSF